MTHAPFPVHLTPVDNDKVRAVAAGRQKPGYASTHNYSSTMTQLDIDVMGVRAELAVSIFLAVPFNDRILPGGDDGADLEYRGRSVEVKAISYRGGVLIFHSLDEFDSNFAVACFAPNRRVDILGWITRERFAEIHEKRNFGKGLRVFVPQVALRDPREIEQAFRRSA